MSKKFTVETASEGSAGSDFIAAMGRVTALEPGESVTITREVELKEYDVFYGSEHISQGWSQHEVVRATDARDAVLRHAQGQNHTSGTRHLVVGSEHDAAYGAQRVGRVFEITTTTYPWNADFSHSHDYISTRHYNVSEVPVVEPRVFGSAW